MTQLFDRLQFNFDTTKFGTTLDLPEEAVNTIQSMATDIELADWQLNDMANNNVITTNYYVNPLANVCNNITANLSNLVASIYTIPSPDTTTINLLNSAINCIIQLDRFKLHTDNVSGVSETSGSPTIPSYLTAINTGQTLVTLLNKTDGIANSLPAYGSLTSLFVVDEVEANNLVIGENCEIFVNFVGGSSSNLSIFTADSTLLTTDGTLLTADVNTLNITAINNIKNIIDKFNEFIYNRWSHDWNFYANAVKLMDDYFKISNFTNIGTAQTYLLENVIGTPKIKTDIANNNIVIPVTEPEVVPTPPSYYEYFNQF
jgi:hypothetical protein